MSLSVEDLAAKAGVVDINTECSKDDILSLASYCDPWQLIGQRLGLTPAQISAIDGDNRNTDLKRLGALQKWKEMCVFKATYRVLVEALIDCDKGQQAMEVCKHLAQKERSLGVTAPPDGVHKPQANASAVPPGSRSTNQDQPRPAHTSPSSPTPAQPTTSTCTSSPSASQSAATQAFPNPINPSHLQLVKWKDRQGKTHRFYLMDVIGNKWRTVGHQLGLLPSQLEGTATQFGNNATECCRAVLGEWLENPPTDYPATWEGLMELLEDCKLTQVAVNLKAALTEAKLL